MIDKPRVRYALLLAVVGVHLLAIALFELDTVRSPYGEDWPQQFYFLVALSAIAGILGQCFPRPRIIWAMLAIRTICALLISTVMGTMISAYSMLFALLLLEAPILTGSWLGLVYAISLITCFTYLRLSVNTVWFSPVPKPPLRDMLSAWSQGLLASVAGQSLRFQIDRRNELHQKLMKLEESTARLVQAHMRLQEFTVSSEQSAALRERRRISRDIHDSIGYTLTNVFYMLDACRQMVLAGAENAVKQIEEAMALSQSALQDIRRSVRTLRDPAKPTYSWMAAVQDLVRLFAATTKVHVALRPVDHRLELAKEKGATIYRVVQECLTNAFRHGQAKHINITLSVQQDGLTIRVKDDGCGAESFVMGCGMNGMRERLEAHGGWLSVETKPGLGFLVNGWLPIEEGEYEQNPGLAGG